MYIHKREKDTILPIHAPYLLRPLHPNPLYSTDSYKYKKLKFFRSITLV